MSFAASGLPAGVTVAFNPSTATTGNSVTATFTASSTATLGAATVTLTATSGTLTRTTSVSLTVNDVATQTFTVAASPGIAVGGTWRQWRIDDRDHAHQLHRCGDDDGDGIADRRDGGVQSVDGHHRQLGDGDVHGIEHRDARRGDGHADGDLGHVVAHDDGGAHRHGWRYPGGTLTATPVVSTNSPWFNELQLRIANTGTLTALSVTIVVQRTPGVSYSGQYNTVGGQVTQTNTSTTATITYQFTLNAGQTLPASTGRTFAIQTSGNGTAHPTAGDTYTVTYTSGGADVTDDTATSEGGEMGTLPIC